MRMEALGRTEAEIQKQRKKLSKGERDTESLTLSANEMQGGRERPKT